MLDFYIIEDSEIKPKPDELKNFQYAGGLEIVIFERLIKKGIIDQRFDFYSDFRWSYEFVELISSKTKYFDNDYDVNLMRSITDKAKKFKSGLSALSD